jgi:uncharacterized membrane protein YfcA
VLTLPLMALGGLAAGVLGSILGVGGGFIMVPLLSIVFHVPMHFAVSAGQACVLATSSISASYYIRQHLAHVRLGLALGISSAIGAIAGALVGSHLNGTVLSVAFGFVLMYVAYRMNQGNGKAEQRVANVEACKVDHWGAGQALAFVGGVLSGLLGIGGGLVNVPVMCLVMGVPMRLAAATSTYMIGMTAVAGVTVYYAKGMMDLLVAGACACGVFLGALVGPRIGMRVHTRYLRLTFGVVALYTAYTMILKALPLTKSQQVVVSVLLLVLSIGGVLLYRRIRDRRRAHELVQP